MHRRCPIMSTSEIASAYVAIRAKTDKLVSDMSGVKNLLTQQISAARIAGLTAFEGFGAGLSAIVGSGMHLLSGNVQSAAQSAGKGIGTMIGAGIGLALGDVTGSTARTL